MKQNDENKNAKVLSLEEMESVTGGKKKPPRPRRKKYN